MARFEDPGDLPGRSRAFLVVSAASAAPRVFRQSTPGAGLWRPWAFSPRTPALTCTAPTCTAPAVRRRCRCAVRCRPSPAPAVRGRCRPGGPGLAARTGCRCASGASGTRRWRRPQQMSRGATGERIHGKGRGEAHPAGKASHCVPARRRETTSALRGCASPLRSPGVAVADGFATLDGSPRRESMAATRMESRLPEPRRLREPGDPARTRRVARELATERPGLRSQILWGRTPSVSKTENAPPLPSRPALVECELSGRCTLRPRAPDGAPSL